MQKGHQQLPNLPKSSDAEFWHPTSGDPYSGAGATPADQNIVDMDTRQDLICGKTRDPEDHVYKINFQQREVTCERCGLGFQFLPHTVEYTNGQLFLKLPDPSGSGKYFKKWIA